MNMMLPFLVGHFRCFLLNTRGRGLSAENNDHSRETHVRGCRRVRRQHRRAEHPVRSLERRDVGAWRDQPLTVLRSSRPVRASPSHCAAGDHRRGVPSASLPRSVRGEPSKRCFHSLTTWSNQPTTNERWSRPSSSSLRQFFQPRCGSYPRSTAPLTTCPSTPSPLRWPAPRHAERNAFQGSDPLPGGSTQQQRGHRRRGRRTPRSDHPCEGGGNVPRPVRRYQPPKDVA